MTSKSMNSFTLIADEGPLNGQRWSIDKETIIGRDIGSDILIPSRQVSRYHARFSFKEEGVVLEDLGSKNGTHVNGQQVVDPVDLHDGDIIQIALAQTFSFYQSDITLSLEEIDLLKEGEQQIESRVRIDKRSHRVYVLNQELTPPLSAAQYRLLELLYDQQGLVVSRDEIVNVVWGEEHAIGVSEQAIDALVRRIRDRFASVDPLHNYIVTVRGHGIYLDNPTRSE